MAAGSSTTGLLGVCSPRLEGSPGALGWLSRVGWPDHIPWAGISWLPAPGPPLLAGRGTRPPHQPPPASHTWFPGRHPEWKPELTNEA